MIMPWRAERLPSMTRPTSLLFGAAGGDGALERVHADELLALLALVLVDGDGEIDAAGEGVDLFAELVPVEGHRGLEAERVAARPGRWA
jgi:hypothetical protein